MTGQGNAMERLMAALGPGKQRGLPPVERWNPPFCGDLDMRIAADGTWFYMGTPIGRPALVKLFSSVLKREGDDYFLVTPVEKVGIRVEDAPFQAVEMQLDGEGDGRGIAFRTQVDDLLCVGPDHALRFERAARDGLKPYVHVRRGLWARLTRALTYDLLALGTVRQVDGQAMFGIAASGLFYPALPASEIEDIEM
ncbi:Proteophosphoglycan precursor (Fragment) [Hyphomicrobiales bacterium]